MRSLPDAALANISLCMASLIGLGDLPVDQAPLRLFHGIEDRRRAVLVPIHTDTQVDLVLARIVLVFGDQPQDRIGGKCLEILEHAISPERTLARRPQRARGIVHNDHEPLIIVDQSVSSGILR
jgi:hypothetical protein